MQGQSGSQSSTIRAIDANSVHKITSAQVVVDLPTAVKELLENSLDAGATAIEVRFKEYGLEGLEVVDNGSGISEADLSTVALNHHTSKLAAFEDLEKLNTFGFRGEALSSLCALSKVKLQTSTAETEPKGWTIEFDKLGNITSKKVCSRPRGTTITINSLFYTLPVRQKQFAKDYKKHFAQAQTLLQAYGLISTNLNLKVSNQPAKGPKVFQFQTQPNANIRQNFANIFTVKASQSVIDFELNLRVSPDKMILKALALSQDDGSEPEAVWTAVKVEGLISKPAHGQGRTSADRQFFYINGRPFAPSKVAKCVNEIYKQFNTNQYPVVLANFLLSPDAYDLNIDPNKRTVFLHSEQNLIEALKIELEIAFQPHRSTFALSRLGSSSFSLPPSSQIEGTSTQSLKRKVPIVQPSHDPTPESGIEVDANMPTKKARVENLDIPIAGPSNVAQDPLPLFLPESTSDTEVHDRPSQSSQPSVAPSVTPNDRDADPPEPWVPSALRDGSTKRWDRTPVQMTLDTSSASWNLKKSDTDSSKGKIAISRKGTRKPDSSMQRMKDRLQQFTRGADVDEGKGKMSAEEEIEVDDDEDSEDESFTSEMGVRKGEIEEEEAETRRRSTSQRSSMIDDDVGLDHHGPADHETCSNSPHQGSSAPARAGSNQWRDEIASGHVNGEVVVPLDMDRLEMVWARRVEPKNALVTETDAIDEISAAGVGESESQATAVLSRTVHQNDFATMKVIGQFNLGFIIAGLGSDDVVIVDQHASDEKYNFERLQRETKLSGQRLLTPRVLDLPAAEELTAMEHRDLLELNGFGISVDEEAPVGQRVKLVAQPVSRDTVWGPSDLEELIHLIRNADLGAGSSKIQPGAPPLRPSKTRKMLASRACRASVMIGDSLTMGQMRSILNHMGTMEEPWACPHGRPTMRWLARCEGDVEVDSRENVQELLEASFL
ncbi:hypothetical protein CROQUDRAFT_660779 [Cronartium quercuum f. sp. fusiforme G11]|uniref:DNA mismatch repair protein PMS1 n=1 Tax=Cronartium quercuum f. sp. fusiforme G11 TaxID=708437 RepID=A0A9P6NCW9_9BASI|nr:hypothetical protein CROQUDRAFT_660779 [Cronartium quercuum f. sp. fusiforme G11]